MNILYLHQESFSCMFFSSVFLPRSCTKTSFCYRVVQLNLRGYHSKILYYRNLGIEILGADLPCFLKVKELLQIAFVGGIISY